MLIFIKKKKMHQTFDITRTSRKIISQLLQDFTLAQLNAIPEGFNNNIIWNIGHIVVVQQMLVYKLSGLPMLISDEMVQKYQKGSKPEHQVTQEEAAEIQSLLFETINQTKADFNSKKFHSFQEYATSTGFIIKNVEDALSFNYFHEAIHLGVILSIRKFV
jgi:hypothetical protein